MQIDYSMKGDVYYNADRTQLLAHFPPSIKRLLDIGCAGGGFGEMIQRQYETEVWGVEPFELAAEMARKKISRVLCMPIEDALIELPENSFDCISFNDVLEHLSDPWTVLKNIRSKLSAGGLVFAVIPNVMFHRVLRDLLLKGDWRYTSQGVLDQTHLRFFTRKSIVRMFNECGYEITYISGLLAGTRSIKMKIMDNLIFKGHLKDIQFLQFVVHAKAL
jgi:2-polyprenyl-3-methyl-5-hydroxy-6-metoxy-1,4-benzoquinol methylase